MEYKFQGSWLGLFSRVIYSFNNCINTVVNWGYRDVLDMGEIKKVPVDGNPARHKQKIQLNYITKEKK